MAASVVEGDWKDAEAVRALGAAAGRRDARERVRRRRGARRRSRRPARRCGPAPPCWPRCRTRRSRRRCCATPACRRRRGVVAEGPDDLAAAGRDLGWPLMLKARKLGYDGYGNATCRRRGRGPRGVRPPRRRRGRAGGGHGRRSRARAGGDGRALAVGRGAPLPGRRDGAARPRLPRGRGAAPVAGRRAAAGRRGGRRRGRRGRRPRRDGRRDVPHRRRRGPGERARAPPAQLGPLHHRGLRDVAVREPPARRARPAARRGGHARARRGDGQPARLRVGARAAATWRPPSPSRAPTCTSTTRRRSGRGRKMGHVTALGAIGGRGAGPPPGARRAAVGL